MLLHVQEVSFKTILEEELGNWEKHSPARQLEHAARWDAPTFQYIP